jgi:hypothetical protein
MACGGGVTAGEGVGVAVGVWVASGARGLRVGVAVAGKACIVTLSKKTWERLMYCQTPLTVSCMRALAPPDGVVNVVVHGTQASSSPRLDPSSGVETGVMQDPSENRAMWTAAVVEAYCSEAMGMRTSALAL